MMNKFMAVVLAYIFATSQVFANTQNQKDLSTLLVKYEYMLSAHPKAHLDSFRKETMDALTNDLSELKETCTNYVTNCELFYRI